MSADDPRSMAILCTGCRCVAAALAEVGMDPERVMCGLTDGTVCAVGYGTGNEGLSLAEVERLCDKATAVCAGSPLDDRGEGA